MSYAYPFPFIYPQPEPQPLLVCCLCGGLAEGEWEAVNNGGGEVCNACADKGQEAPAPAQQEVGHD